MIKNKKLIIPPGTVLIKKSKEQIEIQVHYNINYKATETQRYNYKTKVGVVVDIAANVNNFKKDFNVEIGDEVLFYAYDGKGKFSIGEDMYYIQRPGNIFAAFKDVKDE